MTVPYFRLELSEDEIAAVVAVMKGGWLTTGKEVAAFEAEFATAIGGGVEAIAVNSNTVGMHLALDAIGLSAGDEVIVPTLTFTATAEVVRYLGADPIFVDVEPDTLCMDPRDARRRITPRTKAVMPVHFGGLSADMAAIGDLARKDGLAVIEDAAHAFPATTNGRNIGTSGSTAAVFSFYANKTITTGEGGMIVTQNKDVARRCRVMRLHGIDRDAYDRFNGRSSAWQYDVIAAGYKYNLTDMAAALGRGQLARADALRLRRQAIADMYREGLANLPLTLPPEAPGGDAHAWHLFPVRVLDSRGRYSRDGLIAALEENGIGYSVHYTPLHRMTYWRERYDLSPADFPVAEEYFQRCASLPIHSYMTDHEVRSVCRVIRGFFGKDAGSR